MTDKTKSLGETLIATGLPIVFGLIAPTIERALAGGTAAEVVAATINDASFRAAVAVVEGRHDGAKVSPLAVLALQLEDIAAKLDDAGKPIAAAHIREEAHKLRAAVAATADTEPPA